MSKPLIDKVVRVRKGLTNFFNKVSSAYSSDELIYELMVHRQYTQQDMFDTLKEIGVFKVDYLSEIRLAVPDVTNEELQDWGLLTSKGDYLLSGRFVVPIRDIAGQVVALVGWHPRGGSRKYVTTSTFGFSRDASFFNLDCYKDSWAKWNGLVFVVEGIFDTISLRSIGLPVVGNMGLEMGSIKGQILARFGKKVAIPDNDKAGRSVNPFTNSISDKGKKFTWDLGTNRVFVSLPQGIKDIDKLIEDYDCFDDLVACKDAKYLKKLKLTS